MIHLWRCFKNGRLLVPLQKVRDPTCQTLILQELNQTKNGVLLPYLGWSWPISTVLTEFKSFDAALLVMNYFQTYSLFPTGETGSLSLLNLYFYIFNFKWYLFLSFISSDTSMPRTQFRPIYIPFIVHW